MTFIGNCNDPNQADHSIEKILAEFETLPDFTGTDTDEILCRTKKLGCFACALVEWIGANSGREWMAIYESRVLAEAHSWAPRDPDRQPPQTCEPYEIEPCFMKQLRRQIEAHELAEPWRVLAKRNAEDGREAIAQAQSAVRVAREAHAEVFRLQAENNALRSRLRAYEEVFKFEPLDS